MNFPERAWEELKREFASLSSQAVEDARSELTKELNQSIRRLRQYQGEREWSSALIDALAPFAPQAAIFEVRKDMLALRRQINPELPEQLEFPLASAAAFQSAIEAKDAVVALRSPSEVTEHLSRPGSAARAHLLPIANGNKVVAVVFAADDGEADLNGLELVVGVASAVLERQSNREMHGQIAAAPKSPAGHAEEPNAIGHAMQASAGQPAAAGAPRAKALPKWADLDEKGQMLHVRAQRFSRVTVAEMQLSRPEACRAGREKGNLYLFLNNEIEAARNKFREQFMVIPSMVDYLHLELVRAAADGDPKRLGADYPGQLI
ncbi:MAG: hypothetical protein ACJ746_30950 [Bryobacteraceae bacterium]